MTRFNLTTAIVCSVLALGVHEAALADHDYCEDGYSLSINPSAVYSHSHGSSVVRPSSTSYYYSSPSYYSYPRYSYGSYFSPGWGFGFGLGSHYYGGHGYRHRYGYGGHSYGGHGYGGHGGGGHGGGGH